jgi:hypothetical protein
MTAATDRLDPVLEHLTARLSEAAYGAALEHGIQGSFLDLQLGIWHHLREVVRREILLLPQHVLPAAIEPPVRRTWSPALAEVLG